MTPTSGGTPGMVGQDQYGMLKQLLTIAALKSPKDASKYASILSLAKPEDEAGDANTRKRRVVLNQAVPVLNSVTDYALKAPTGVSGAWRAFIGKAPGVGGGDAEMLDRQTKGFARLIASAFASEVGVATDKDVERWLGLMPRPGDTKGERVQALNNLFTQIEAESKGLGLDVPETVKESRKKLGGQGSNYPSSWRPD